MEKINVDFSTANVAEITTKKGSVFGIFFQVGNAPVMQTGFSSEADAKVAIGFAEKIIAAINAQSNKTAL